jgi:hypothetical protein
MFGLITAASLGFTSTATAQVFIRAPFVRVQVGPGVSVQAPGVGVFVPSPGYPATVYAPGMMYGPGYYGPAYGPGYGPGFGGVPPGISVPPVQLPAPTPVPVPDAPAAPPAPPAPPMPPAINGTLTPPTAPAGRAMTVEEFARSFQPKAGSYEVTVLNPITNTPNTVRFTLPEGTPRRVIVNRRNLEFVYGPRQFVRIEFDRDGAQVTAR